MPFKQLLSDNSAFLMVWKRRGWGGGAPYCEAGALGSVDAVLAGSLAQPTAIPTNLKSDKVRLWAQGNRDCYH